jgi:hypothetical protein
MASRVKFGSGTITHAIALLALRSTVEHSEYVIEPGAENFDKPEAIKADVLDTLTSKLTCIRGKIPRKLGSETTNRDASSSLDWAKALSDTDPKRLAKSEQWAAGLIRTYGPLAELGIGKVEWNNENVPPVTNALLEYVRATVKAHRPSPSE